MKRSGKRIQYGVFVLNPRLDGDVEYLSHVCIAVKPGFDVFDRLSTYRRGTAQCCSAFSLPSDEDWFETARDSKIAAQLRYAHCLSVGHAVSVDLVEAARYYRLAADHNDAEAQFQYADCLSTGLGVSVDFFGAVKYYKLAADQGDLDTQFRYADCLSVGCGVSADSVEAVNYYRLAAAHNHSEPQFPRISSRPAASQLVSCRVDSLDVILKESRVHFLKCDGIFVGSDCSRIIVQLKSSDHQTISAGLLPRLPGDPSSFFSLFGIADRLSCVLSRRFLPGRSNDELRNWVSALLRLFGFTVADGLTFHIDLVFLRTRSLVLHRMPEALGQLSLYVVVERLSTTNSRFCCRDSGGWLLIRGSDIEGASSFQRDNISLLGYIRDPNCRNFIRSLLKVDRRMRRSRKRSRSASVAEFSTPRSESLCKRPQRALQMIVYCSDSEKARSGTEDDRVILIRFPASSSVSLSMPIRHGLK
jgi:hypothetical protein